MKRTSTIEITDQEYLIKLPREDFQLSFIKRLLTRIHQKDCLSVTATTHNDDEVIRKEYGADSLARFDRLDEK